MPADDFKAAWPDWAEPALRSHIIIGLVEIRSAVTNLSEAAIALQANDQERFASAMTKCLNALDDMGKTIDRIGGDLDGD